MSLKSRLSVSEAGQAGDMTKAQIFAYTGGDYDDNISELAREQELAQSTGVTLDKDILDAGLPAIADVPAEPPAPAEEPPARAKRTTRKRKTT